MVMKRAWPILVVDDEPETLRILMEFLTEEGYSVQEASNGQDALDLIARNDYAVVLTDWVMPQVGGDKIIEAVKTRNALTEVVVLTAYLSLQSMVEAIHYHVFDYLQKPIDLDRLSRTLDNALNQHRLALENQRIISRLNQQQEILRNRIEEVSRELEQLSTVDALTGLYNYRYFSDVLQTEISRSIRYGRPLTLAMLDLDYFKYYNDNYGHAKGNEALFAVAHRMQSMVREVDILIRYGGEEFAILLPETPKEKAKTNITRVCQCIRDMGLEVTTPDGKRLITLSCGLAACPEDAQDGESLVVAADLALYRAKSMGRNQVVFYTAALREAEEARS